LEEGWSLWTGGSELVFVFVLVLVCVFEPVFVSVFVWGMRVRLAGLGLRSFAAR
jgi:hypothetical protein